MSRSGKSCCAAPSRRVLKRDLKLIRALFKSYAYVTELIDDKNTSMTRLRKLLFGPNREDGQRGRTRSAGSNALDRTGVPGC